MESSLHASPGLWRLCRWRSAVITVAAQITSSMIAHCWQDLGQTHLWTTEGEWHQRGEPEPLKEWQPCWKCPRKDIPCIKHQMQTPFMNPNPFKCWYRIKNVAQVWFNGESCLALLDNGAQINTITPGFIENHSLDVGPLSDLKGRWVSVQAWETPSLDLLAMSSYRF